MEEIQKISHGISPTTPPRNSIIPSIHPHCWQRDLLITIFKKKEMKISLKSTINFCLDAQIV